VTTSAHSTRFGFAIAEAGLAKGLVLFQPTLDSFPDDMPVDFSGLEEKLVPFVPAVEVVRDPQGTVDRFREEILKAFRDTAVPDTPTDQLEFMFAMQSDHAEEYFQQLRKLAEAADSQVRQPDPPWRQHPWIDRLGNLDIPVTAAVTAKGIEVGSAIARRARNAEVVVISEGWIGLAPVQDRIKAAGILLNTLDRAA
jgi:hypothetical protein